MQLTPYLSFRGDCEDALAFYATVFGGKTVQFSRFGDAPTANEMSLEQQTLVMHATFESPTVRFMASDSPTGIADGTPCVSLSLTAADNVEGRRVFEGLSANGTVTMPLASAFWGGDFGMLVDRFGITWLMSC